MIKINRDSLSEVRKFLCDGGYYGENFAGSVREINRASVEGVKRNELRKICCFAETPGSRAFFRLAGEYQQAPKELRAETSYFASNGDSGLYCGHIENIPNKALGKKRAPQEKEVMKPGGRTDSSVIYLTTSLIISIYTLNFFLSIGRHGFFNIIFKIVRPSETGLVRA